MNVGKVYNPCKGAPTPTVKIVESNDVGLGAVRPGTDTPEGKIV